MYPNPSTTGTITIETIENLKNADVDIFSLSGQKLFSTQVPILDERKSIDLSGLAQGIYLVRVRSAGFDVSRRIIINR
ncbi:T9SS type A sorting domain-containing protein [Spirosoma telluris]|uniref:T9SS type A sorting domain-containing protein n=1 Tax=Spirosoma telluris TaxID=2183553 RepID=UPI002FC3000D